MVTNKSSRKAFATRLRQALNEAGYARAKLKDLGALFDVSPQAVRKWLSGEAKPAPDRAGIIASILGVRRAWLIDGELPMRLAQISVKDSSQEYSKDDETILSISGEEYRLIKGFRNLPHDLKNAIETIIEELSRSLKNSTDQ